VIYLALIHQDEPEGAFGVSFPDFPGCITASNRLTEVKALATAALRGRIAAMQAVGLAIPEPSTLRAIMQHPDYADLADPPRHPGGMRIWRNASPFLRNRSKTPLNATKHLGLELRNASDRVFVRPCHPRSPLPRVQSGIMTRSGSVAPVG
jgi:predicted RNase H-like HicB family nuclease